MAERPVIVFAPVPGRGPVRPVLRFDAPEEGARVQRPVIRFGVPEEPGSGAVPELGVDLWDLVRERHDGYGRMQVRMGVDE